MSGYTVEQVCKVAERVDDLLVHDMLRAYAERIKADEMAAQSARERVEMALREPNSAKAAQVASELGAAHRAISPPAQAAQVGGIRLSAPAWPGQMEGKAPPDGWVMIEADLAPIAKPTLGEFVRMPDAERVAIGQQVAERVDEMTVQPTKLEDAVREVIAYLQKGHRFDVEQADKLTAALQENAK